MADQVFGYMLVGGNPNKKEFWDPILSNISKRCGRWKRSFLSRGERLSLIQSVLGAIPSYYFSLFKIPNGVATYIEQFIRGFWWKGCNEGGGGTLVAWDHGFRLKDKWGIVIGNIANKNKALVSK